MTLCRLSPLILSLALGACANSDGGGSEGAGGVPGSSGSGGSIGTEGGGDAGRAGAAGTGGAAGTRGATGSGGTTGLGGGGENSGSAGIFGIAGTSGSAGGGGAGTGGAGARTTGLAGTNGAAGTSGTAGKAPAADSAVPLGRRAQTVATAARQETPEPMEGLGLPAALFCPSRPTQPNRPKMYSVTFVVSMEITFCPDRRKMRPDSRARTMSKSITFISKPVNILRSVRLT
jgi:hypothetical protein